MGKRTVSAVEDVLERHGKRGELATALSVAKISMPPGEFVGIVAVIAVVAGLVGLLIGGPFIALLLATVVCLGVRFYVRRTKAKRQAASPTSCPRSFIWSPRLSAVALASRRPSTRWPRNRKSPPGVSSPTCCSKHAAGS